MKSPRKSKLRWVELGAVLALLVVAVLLAMPIIRNTLNPGELRTCQDTLRQWGTIFKMYSKENEWRWPLPHGYESFGMASNAPGCTNVNDDFDFCPDLDLIFPDYATDPLLLACPDSPGILPAVTTGPLVLRPRRLDPSTYGIVANRSIGSCEHAGTITNGDASYTYLGWRIDPFEKHPQISYEQAVEFGLPATGPAVIVSLLAHLQPANTETYQDIQARRGTALNPSNYLLPLDTYYVYRAGNDGSDVVGILWHGISYLYYGYEEPPDEYPWLPTTPVMWDTLYQDPAGNPFFTHHEPAGVNVLYLDGHVEFKTYPGPFPVAESFATMKRVP